MVGIESKYGFPLFTKDHSTEYLVKNERLRVSDIWAFWNYIIRMYKNKNSRVNKDFLLSLLDQAQYFYKTAEKAPIRSQPLLYYYSLLNFVKIVINLENYQGEARSYQHGVNHLGVSAGSKLSSMRVGIHAIGGASVQVCPEFMTLMGDNIPPLAHGTTYDLGIKDLLKSCIGIHRTYCETFNMKEEYVRIEDIQLWRDGKNLTFKALIPKCDATLMTQLNAAGYHVVDEVQIDGVTHLYYWTENIVMATYSPTRQNLYDLSYIVRDKGIWYFTDGSEYEFVKGDLADKALIDGLFEKYHFDVVVNLAAQAGVRYSITNPDAYIESNIIGFYNILEACRHNPVQHLVYASSSSVYGGNKKVPFSTDDRVDNPVSLYAATKKSNELFAHCYSKLYDIPTTGLRFFTVYGPAGRPDMAYFGFTNKLLKGETIQIFNYGNCRRDFTYVDDIVEGVYRVMQKAPERKKGEDGLPIPPYAVYNIGGGLPENLLDFVNILQEELVRAGVLPADFDFEAHKKLVPMQPGDVPTTYADATALERDFGFTPKITLREGLRKFAEWYKEFYGHK